MWVITTLPYGNGKRAYFNRFELGFPNFTLKVEEAKRFKLKREARAYAIENGIRNIAIEKI